MTTIAYRNGVLAADTVACRGDSKIAGVTKIARGPDGRLGGACGGAGFMGGWLAWIADPSQDRPEPKTDEKSSDSGLIVWPDGKIEVFESGGSFVFDAPYYAMGSGRCEALGAMHAGATAEQAVEAAVAHDCGTGGEVMSLSRAAALEAVA